MRIIRKWRRAWRRSVSLQGAPVRKEAPLKENIWRKGRAAAVVAAIATVLAGMPNVSAAPSSGQVAFGLGAITQQGQTTVVSQYSNRLTINWQQFDLSTAEGIRFLQPGNQAAALNRVLSGTSSIINGSITANGQVFLVNPNGIQFTPTANVQVGGLVASSLDISDSNFWNGRYSFSQFGANGAVINQGTLTANDGGFLALLGSEVRNEGVMVARQGVAALASGGQVTLDFNGDGLLKVAVDQAAVNAFIENKNVMQADGGQVIMTARAADSLASTVINNKGIIRAKSINNVNGVIRLDGGTSGSVVYNTGVLDVSGSDPSQNGGRVEVTASAIAHAGDIQANGKSGGTVSLQAGTFIQEGTISADGLAGTGGAVRIQADNRIIQTSNTVVTANSSSGQGGQIELSAGQEGGVFTSGRLMAVGDKGGQIRILGGQDVTLAAAMIAASGNTAGGTVLIGGDYQGSNPAISDAAKTYVNHSTEINADATGQGNGGRVIVRSNNQTDFYGTISARGGQSGSGGLIEVSGSQSLNYGGQTDAGSPLGRAGNLYISSNNINVTQSNLYPRYELLDPNPHAGENFGSFVVPLPSGNVVVTDPGDSLVNTYTGAVYLYDGMTGGLKSILVGSNAGDSIGSFGVTLLANGNYLVNSPSWNEGRGAVTWASGTAGISGYVSSDNSLIGSAPNDGIGSYGIVALSNGNYVVQSPNWGEGRGAVTWGNGSSGIRGEVSPANSLVGSTASNPTTYIVGDGVGSGSVTPLPNGNYVVTSPNWGNTRGAVTWGNGSSGIRGEVSSTNSLVGSKENDWVGTALNSVPAVTVLANGNYVVLSPNWGDGRGAVTWGNGSRGISGAVSVVNSLVGSTAYSTDGSTAGDLVGSNGITALSNGNYVVLSPYWTDSKGAATWGDGNTGITGEVSAANSLIGSFSGDYIGYGGATALTNGNYVIVSPDWKGGRGAVTWANGSIGITGGVSFVNSLVGSTATDAVGEGAVTPLSNGNYAVISSNWGSGRGAVTWGSGTSGIAGLVSETNSLVGSTATNLSTGIYGDNVGAGGVTALTNGSYVVASPYWSSGRGAVTWGSGIDGISGYITTMNSLLGSMSDGTSEYDFLPGDSIGSGGITALTNGNFVVASPNWGGGKGAVTWGSGNGGVTGVVTSANSLVGSTPYNIVGGTADYIGGQGVTALTNGNYVVSSIGWNLGRGAVSWGSGTSGVSGEVSTANSLVGSAAGDYLGEWTVAAPDGNFITTSASNVNGQRWITWGDGVKGVKGEVSSLNSFQGLSGYTNPYRGLNNNNSLLFASFEPEQKVYAGVTEHNPLYTNANLKTAAVGAAFVSKALDSAANVSLRAAGDVAINADLRWIGNTMLMLSANHNITINDGYTLSVAGSGGGGLILKAGADGGGLGTVTFAGTGKVDVTNGGVNGKYVNIYYNPADYTSPTDYLSYISGGSLGNTRSYMLVNDVNQLQQMETNLSGTYALSQSIDASSTSSWNSGAGFRPIGGLSSPFQGTFEGSRYSISGLTIHRPDWDYVGLFGVVARPDPASPVASIRNVGLTDVDITGRNFVGGLAGYSYNQTNIINSYSLGAINSVSTYVGGLVGNNSAFISSSFSAGQVQGPTNAGGLVGLNGGYIYNSYSTSDVVATAWTAGGLVGLNENMVSNSFSTGAVNAPSGAGGLIGRSTGNTTQSYWDRETSGQGVSAGGSGLTTSQMKTVSSYPGWDFSSTWKLYEGYTYPLLKSFLTPLTISFAVNNDTKVYDGTPYSGGAGVTLPTALPAGVLGTISYGGTSQGAKNAGTYSIIPSGLYSGQLGYDIHLDYVGGTLTIEKRDLHVTASGISKTYDGATNASVAYSSDQVAGDVVTISGASAFDDKNTGTGKKVTVTNIGIGGMESDNYNLVSNSTSTTADITPRELLVTAAGSNKLYNGLTDANVVYSSNKVTGDAITITGTANFADKTVGIGKSVTVTNIGISGADASNYLLVNTMASTTADIAKKQLTPRLTSPVTKFYDGKLGAVLVAKQITLYGSVPDDKLVLSYDANGFYDNGNPGIGKQVTAYNVSVAGEDANNYSLVSSMITDGIGIIYKRSWW